ncbi:MAG: hypothetical protein EOO63_06420 [Hymenobacter sp.]|nr:MAG: hypothetical protein EOO63_06420 [Hymenobacter sp.]
MNLFRLTSVIGGLGLLAGGLSACLKAPEYPITPSISFNRIEVRRTNFANPQQQPIDSVFITVNFQDGNGDLGLTEAESKVAPYAFPSLFNNNYFIEPFIKDRTGRFVSTVSLGLTTTGAYNGRFDHPSTLTDGKAAPLKGTLTRTIGFGYGDVFTQGQVVRFDVSIADRALNLSNVIRTDSIVIANR